ncbi:MAG TPA: DUF1684 domain-containing protein [Flavobacteriales bacterium]|nr:DUF1684 domain-containing protein [Flavobacteriales bacterium]
MRSIVLFAMIGLQGVVAAQSESKWLEGLERYWAAIDSAYRDTVHSPLPKEERGHFTQLPRFQADKAFRVNARYEPVTGEVFGMKTSTEREPKYQPMGILHFTLEGVEEQLTVYRNIDLSRLDGYRNYLFVPFTDLTNGESTYGGGRYLDLEGPLGNAVELDFNRAYNPYCAYGGSYSCPIPPLENHLEVAVRAGVLKHHD